MSDCDSGSPILLVHGFPESWWAFHKLIPLLAQHHRVYAVDASHGAVAGDRRERARQAVDTTS